METQLQTYTSQALKATTTKRKPWRNYLTTRRVEKEHSHNRELHLNTLEDRKKQCKWRTISNSVQLDHKVQEEKSEDMLAEIERVQVKVNQLFPERSLEHHSIETREPLQSFLRDGFYFKHGSLAMIWRTDLRAQGQKQEKQVVKRMLK